MSHGIRVGISSAHVAVVCPCRTLYIKRAIARGITYQQLVEGDWQDDSAKHRLFNNLGRKDQLDPTMIDRIRTP